MALSRFVLTSTVTLAPDVAAALVAGQRRDSQSGHIRQVRAAARDAAQGHGGLRRLQRGQHWPAAPVPGDRGGQPARLCPG